MNTATIPTQRTPDKPFERLSVLEAISNHPDENVERYEDELKAIFGFDPGSDPDPSEWFPPKEFSAFRPYLEIARRARRASLLAVEALGRRRVMARDIAGLALVTTVLSNVSFRWDGRSLTSVPVPNAGTDSNIMVLLSTVPRSQSPWAVSSYYNAQIGKTQGAILRRC